MLWVQRPPARTKCKPDDEVASNPTITSLAVPGHLVADRARGPRVGRYPARGSTSMSSFWSSAHQGDTDRLVELLSQGQDVDEYCPAGVSAYRPTALAYAVWGNQPDAVALLLERAGFVIFSENTPFSFLFSFSVGKFSGSPSSTALIVVAARAVVQPAPEEEDLTKEGEGEQRWLLHMLYTVLSLRK